MIFSLVILWWVYLIDNCFQKNGLYLIIAEIKQALQIT